MNSKLLRYARSCSWSFWTDSHSWGVWPECSCSEFHFFTFGKLISPCFRHGFFGSSLFQNWLFPSPCSTKYSSLQSSISILIVKSIFPGSTWHFCSLSLLTSLCSSIFTSSFHFFYFHLWAFQHFIVVMCFSFFTDLRFAKHESSVIRFLLKMLAFRSVCFSINLIDFEEFFLSTKTPCFGFGSLPSIAFHYFLSLFRPILEKLRA